MRANRRIAHCSDAHLDNDYYGGERNLDRRDYYRGVFARLLEQVTATKPDLMLLAGDLFDTNRASEGTIQWAMGLLESLPFAVVMIPGNHDCLTESGVYRRYDFNAISNVTLLNDEAGETVTLRELGVSIWGQGMHEHTPEYQPLAGVPANTQNGTWNLGLGHGIYVEQGASTLHSSPVHAEQIATSAFDYLALGHHHGLMDVSAGDTLAYYSGAPTPIVDDRGTFITVELDESRGNRALIHELS